MTSTVTSSATFSTTLKSLASRRPSPFGEKWRASRLTSMTGGSLFSRWATKKAAKVAPTSTRKVTRATSAIAPMPLLALVLPDDHDHVPLFRRIGDQGLRVGVELLHVLDVERGRDFIGGGLGPAA